MICEGFVKRLISAQQLGGEIVRYSRLEGCHAMRDAKSRGPVEMSKRRSKDEPTLALRVWAR